MINKISFQGPHFVKLILFSLHSASSGCQNIRTSTERSKVVEKNVFGYSNSVYDEIGIYIVCDDSKLLGIINQMLRKNGMMSISDTAGRHHFLIDARTNPCLATQCIRKLLLTQPEDERANLLKPDPSDSPLESAIHSVLDEHGFDKTLIGTSLITSLLQYLYVTGVKVHYKKIYAEVGKIYAMSSDQVSRNIRYSLQKSLLWHEGLKNSSAFFTLLEEVKDAMVIKI